MTRCYANLAAKDGGQVALVGKASFLCDQSKRLIGSAHQSFCPLDSPVHHITLRPGTDRLFEATAEVVGTETGHCREISQCQPVIEMGLDIVTNALEPLTRQCFRRLECDRHLIAAEPHDLHCERGIEGVSQNLIEETTLNFIRNG